MNSRYFACVNCKVYIDAGYRWAYCLLEQPGVVRLGEQLSPATVFAASEYWRQSADESAAWLIGRALPVRNFLTRHQEHTLLYLEEDHFCQDDARYERYKEIDIDHAF